MFKVLDDILNGVEDESLGTLLQEDGTEKKEFRSRRKVVCSYCNKETGYLQTVLGCVYIGV